MPMLEVVRTLSDWLAGTLKDFNGIDQGVNSMILTTPRFGGDAAPPNVTIFDEIRSGEVARRQIPQAVVPGAPAILVFQHDVPTSIEPEIPGGTGVGVSRDYDQVPYAIIYAEDLADTATGNQNAHYTMRSVMRSLAQLLRNDNASKRQPNQTAIGPCREVKWLPMWSPSAAADKVMTLGLRVSLDVRDYLPL